MQVRLLAGKTAQAHTGVQVRHQARKETEDAREC
jgi:hypothetical protein